MGEWWWWCYGGVVVVVVSYGGQWRERRIRAIKKGVMWEEAGTYE